MKNKLLFIVIFGIFTSYFSYSQSKTSSPKWKLGVKIAQNDYSRSNNFGALITEPIIIEYKSIYITAGINLEYQFNNYFSLISSLEYSNRNFKSSLNSYKRSLIDYKSNLIQLPISLRFYPKKEKIGFFIQSGFINSYDLSNEILHYNYSINLTASLGYDFKIAKNCHLELYTQYQSISDYYFHNNLLNLNIAIQKAF